MRRIGAITALVTGLGLAGCSLATHPAGSGTVSSTSHGPGPAGRASTGAARTSASRGPSRAAASVSIVAVGDTMFGNMPDLPPDLPSYLHAVRRELHSGAQIVFGNLEGTLTTAATTKCGRHSHPGKKCFAFRDPPGYARYLKSAGFTILNNANNHSFDYGAAGQAQTVQVIRAAGLAQTGLPGEITKVRANQVKVAFLGFAPYSYDTDLLDLPAARALIERARRTAAIVVVYMHAGAEGSGDEHVTGREEYYLGEDRGNAEEFAHMAIDAGASLVIASGPHVLRGMQFYKHRLIAYSLGNFAGYDNFSTEGELGTSVILRVTLSSAGRFKHARIYPIQLTGEGQPRPGGAAVTLIRELSAQDFRATAARIRPSGVISAPRP
jgi:poly-gamma-glutamate capsule biosynthesis protein CapA/YwtB (metallophosphatase superfamily)